MIFKETQQQKTILALLETGSVAEAAKKLNVSPRTIYRRMEENGFMDEYNACLHQCIFEAYERLAGSLTAAADTLAELTQDKSLAPQVRLNAATAIIQNATKLKEMVDFETRLQTLERMAEREADD